MLHYTITLVVIVLCNGAPITICIAVAIDTASSFIPPFPQFILTQFLIFLLSFSLFKDVTADVEEKLRSYGIPLLDVPPTKASQNPFGGLVGGDDMERREVEDIPAMGVSVMCNDVECIFEFRLFKYIGKKFVPSEEESCTTSSSQSALSNESAGSLQGETSLPQLSTSTVPHSASGASNDSARSSLDQMPKSGLSSPLDNRNAPFSPRRASSEGNMIDIGRSNGCDLSASVPPTRRHQMRHQRSSQDSSESVNTHRQNSSAPLLP